MDPLPTYLRKFNTEVHIIPLITSISPLCTIHKCWSIQFLPKFKKNEIFRIQDSLDQIIGMSQISLVQFHLSICFVFELILASRLNIMLGVALNVSFVSVLTLLRWFSFCLISNELGISIYPHSSGNIPSQGNSKCMFLKNMILLYSWR